MKKLIILLLLVMSTGIYAQTLPSIPASGFAFPIGSKFTIKLHPTDSLIYDISVLEFEPFEEVINSFNNSYLFPEEGEDNTIMMYFCYGTLGETDQEKEKNMKIHLLMKNYSKMILEYSSDILRQEDGEFEETSNVGVYPGAIANEMWPYMIYEIGLKDFREYKEE